MINIDKSGLVEISKNELDVKMSLIIGGDIFIHGTVLEKIQKGGSKDIVNDIMPEIENCDFSIANLEGPLTDYPESIQKSGPALKMPPSAVKFIRDSGFDAVTLANNHIGDYSSQGVLDTLEVLDSNKIGYAGAGKNLEAAKKPLKWEVNGLSAALINITENEFGIAEESVPGAAPFDIIENLKQIRKTAEEVDILIVIAHGGIENHPVPRPELTKHYRAFADAGAAAVVAHHPHCPQGMEIHNKVPIIYSLGNFLFPSRNPENLTSASLWHYGYLVRIDFSTKQANALKIIPYSQFADGQSWNVLKGGKLEYFLNYFSELSHIVEDKIKVKRFFDAWTYLNQERLINCLNWGVKTDEKFPMLHVKNEFWCEAHCELAKNLLMLLEKNKLNEAAELLSELERLINIFDFNF